MTVPTPDNRREAPALYSAIVLMAVIQTTPLMLVGGLLGIGIAALYRAFH